MNLLWTVVEALLFVQVFGMPMDLLEDWKCVICLVLPSEGLWWIFPKYMATANHCFFFPLIIKNSGWFWGIPVSGKKPSQSNIECGALWHIGQRLARRPCVTGNHLRKVQHNYIQFYIVLQLHFSATGSPFLLVFLRLHPVQHWISGGIGGRLTQ